MGSLLVMMFDLWNWGEFTCTVLYEYTSSLDTEIDFMGDVRFTCDFGIDS